MLRVRGLEPRKPPEPKSGILPLNYTLLLVLLSLGEHLWLYTPTGKLYISIGLISFIIEMLLLSLCSLFIRRCTCRLRGGLFIFYRPIHTMPKHDVANHELLIANVPFLINQIILINDTTSFKVKFIWVVHEPSTLWISHLIIE